MTGQFCPLFSAKLLNGSPEERQRNIGKLRFPMSASGKYDGWRIFEYNGRASTRSLKETEPKNVHTRAKLREFYRELREKTGLCGLDSEVIVGDVYAPNAMQNTTSGIGSFDGQPEITVLAFDSYQFGDQPFRDRLRYVEDALAKMDVPWVRSVEHVIINDLPEMWAYMEQQMSLGLEGIMLRKSDGPYKMGRSSINEGILIAVKKWETTEGMILSVNEQLHNANEATTNALGHTERSGHRENMHGKNTMGSVTVRSAEFIEDFNVGGGPGLDAVLRQYIWDHPEEFVGKMLTFRYQAEGVKTRPRFPQWMSIRDPGDKS